MKTGRRKAGGNHIWEQAWKVEAPSAECLPPSTIKGAKAGTASMADAHPAKLGFYNGLKLLL